MESKYCDHDEVVMTTTQEKRSTLQDQAIQVLRNTSDGDALDPADLGLLQHVVNAGTLDDLNEQGQARWRYMCESTADGSYQRRWFHDVEHLRCDHDGYQRRHVEHGCVASGSRACRRHSAGARTRAFP